MIGGKKSVLFTIYENEISIFTFSPAERILIAVFTFVNAPPENIFSRIATTALFSVLSLFLTPIITAIVLVANVTPVPFLFISVMG